MSTDRTQPEIEDRNRAIAVARAYGRLDLDGLDALLADVVPTTRDADVDPIGAALDEQRAAPMAAMVRDLSHLVILFAGGKERDREEADARLAALIRDPATGTVE